VWNTCRLTSGSTASDTRKMSKDVALREIPELEDKGFLRALGEYHASAQAASKLHPGLTFTARIGQQRQLQIIPGCKKTQSPISILADATHQESIHT
jgi:hypothetical protein